MVPSQLTSFLRSAWWPAQDDLARPLVDPATDAVVTRMGAPSVALAEAAAWGRVTGGDAVRAVPWRDRIEALRRLAQRLTCERDTLLALSTLAGNTRADARFDVDGAIGVLDAAVAWAERSPDEPLSIGSPHAPLRGRPIALQHVWAPRRGLALHIQAFNFPVWGLIEKFASAWLAGMPVLSKPAPEGAFLAWSVAQSIASMPEFPPGAFQLWLGSGDAMLDVLEPLDVVAFTGSAATARSIRQHDRLRATGARLNVEADSVNAAVIGVDVKADDALFEHAVREITLEATQKAGQKCTAIRRVFVPRACLPALRDALAERWVAAAEATGDPRDPRVTMGPLASRRHRDLVRAGLGVLERGARRIVGDPHRSRFLGLAADQGACFEPVLLEMQGADVLHCDVDVHRHEVFGPVVTLLPYEGSPDMLARAVALGGGGLMACVYAEDPAVQRSLAASLIGHVGRLVLTDSSQIPTRVGPGAVLPQGQHGGPGRAGDGAELGDAIGWSLYRQRVVMQGEAKRLAAFIDVLPSRDDPSSASCPGVELGGAEPGSPES